MNCKPNQRAVFTRTLGVKEAVPYLGVVFTVREVVGNHPKTGPMWRVDPDNVHRGDGLTFKRGDPITEVADACLTPLPDDPGPLVDEDVPQQLEMTQ